MSIRVGDNVPAQNVKGNNLRLLNADSDIGWAFDVHIRGEVNKGEVKGTDGRIYDRMNVKCLILTGWYDDAPDEIWGSIDSKNPRLDEAVTLLYKADND